MDDYLNIYEYVGEDNEQREYSTATSVNEEHEMVKITPQEAKKQTQINKCSTDKSDKQIQNDIKDAPKLTKKCLILMTVLIAMILLMSLAAIVLSIISYNASNLKMIDLKSQRCDLLINQLKDNISQLSNQLDATNNDITLVSTTVEGNISQLLIQLDVINRFAISVQAEVTRLHCGAGEWHRVAYLNMTDPSQKCPSTWREYSSNNTKVCGRVVNTEGSCSSTSFPMTSGPYNRVCGRVIGYQVASPDAFRRYANNHIDLDGINITYGTPRIHIWSYVAGVTESVCPCSAVAGTGPQPFVGDHYYCESGNPADTWQHQLYSGDRLWDGQQCEGTCCNGTNSPPWFSVQLSAPTTDTIQVSICADQSTNDEDTPVELLEIYVQ